MKKALLVSVLISSLMPLVFWAALGEGTTYTKEFNSEEFFNLSAVEQEKWLDENTKSTTGLAVYLPHFREVWFWKLYGKLFLLFFVPMIVGTTVSAKRV